MAQKPIYEVTAKKDFAQKYLELFSIRDGLKVKADCFEILAKNDDFSLPLEVSAQVGAKGQNDTKYVIKPDMLFGKRGKLGLIDLNVKQEEIKQKVINRRKPVTINGLSDILNHFILEEMTIHDSKQEYYLSFEMGAGGDSMKFSFKGGIEVEDNWNEVIELVVSPLKINYKEIKDSIFELLQQNSQGHTETELQLISEFINNALQIFRQNHYSFLEFNPFCLIDKTVHLLDAVARVDDQSMHWSGHDFPKSFGQLDITDEEKQVISLDNKSGSSLKLTSLNPNGPIWCLLAGGGASVVFLDQLIARYDVSEIGNYGEYSGNPTKDEVYQYTKAIISLMLKTKTNKPLKLCIVGATANFTLIDVTFQGIAMAMNDYAKELKQRKVFILARRGGPNTEKGLKIMREKCQLLGLEHQIFGPELLYQDILDYLPKE